MPVKPSLLYRIVNALGDEVPRFVGKHPALVAGGLGLGYGVSEMNKPVHRLEGSIMREYVGGPGAKYSSADLEKFAERKKYLDTRIAFEKIGGKAQYQPPPVHIENIMPPKPQRDWKQEMRSGMGGGFGAGIGGGIAAEGVGAIRRLLGMTAQSINERLIQDPQRKQIVEQAMGEDPDIQTLEQQQPGSAVKAYSTMARYAPELSTDPNVVTAFLRHAAMSGGPVDHTMVKGLAEAETAVQRARNEGAWLRGGF